jgi:transposase
VYHDVAQWAMVRRKVLEEGVSRRELAKKTGLSRKTIRKMLLHKLPQPYKPRTPRHPALQQHTATLDAFQSSNVFATVRHRVSISEMYRYLKIKESY